MENTENLKYCYKCDKIYERFPPRYKHCPECGAEFDSILKNAERKLQELVSNFKRNYCPKCKEEFYENYKHCPYCSTELIKEDIFQLEGENEQVIGKWNDRKIKIMSFLELIKYKPILRDPPTPKPKHIKAFYRKHFFDMALENSFLNRGEDPPKKLTHTEVTHILIKFEYSITNLNFSKEAKFDKIDYLYSLKKILAERKEKEHLLKNLKMKTNELQNKRKEIIIKNEELSKPNFLYKHVKDPSLLENREKIYKRIEKLKKELKEADYELKIYYEEYEAMNPTDLLITEFPESAKDISGGFLIRRIESLREYKKELERQINEFYEELKGIEKLCGEEEKIIIEKKRNLMNELKKIEAELKVIYEQIRILVEDIKKLNEILNEIDKGTLPEFFMSLYIRKDLFANIEGRMELLE